MKMAFCSYLGEMREPSQDYTLYTSRSDEDITIEEEPLPQVNLEEGGNPAKQLFNGVSSEECLCEGKPCNQ